MKRHSLFVLLIAAGLVIGWMRAPAAQGPSGNAAGTVLTGTIQSSTGEPLGGMVVTAAAEGKTMKTSVFTDEQGQYFFPPLAAGSYEVWAQAVGFATSRANVELSGRATRHDFSMVTLEDFSIQLSGAEWLASLPDETPQDARMKEVFRTNCAGCHAASWVLQSRFDRDGWFKMITNMERVGIRGGGEQAVDSAPQPWLRFYRAELADYLAKVAGPDLKLDYEVLPRPSGESARAVITEYDLGSSEDPSRPVRYDGSDWMQGVPSAYEARGSHDADVDPLGFVWIAYGDQNFNAYRTYGRLNPETGEVQDFQIPNGRGGIGGSHGLKVDEQGRVWFDSNDSLQMIDSRDPALTLHTFTPPEEMGEVGGHIQITPQGYIWATSDGGIMFDPETEKFRRFDHPWPGGNTYGIGADSDGNGWWAQMGGLPYDELGKGDLKTGKSTAIPLGPVPGLKELATPADLEFYEITGSQTNMAPIWSHGPRRLMGDKHGNMWVGNWWSNSLGQVDIKTHEVTYHNYPGEHVGIYQPVIDNENRVWVNLMTADRVTRYDPETDTWVDFVLPNRGTETRHLAVDNFKPQPEAWTPYWRTNQLARIQLRTPEQIQALREIAAAALAAR